MSTATVKTFAGLGVICAVAIIIVGLSADWRPYLLISIWGLVGLCYWLLRGRSIRRAAAA
jgi:APA family basic amino acid/polyamine antiporter